MVTNVMIGVDLGWSPWWIWWGGRYYTCQSSVV